MAWKAKAKIAYNTLIQDIQDGGLKLIDAKIKEKSLKMCMDSMRIQNYTDSIILEYITIYLSTPPINILFQTNLNKRDITKLIPDNTLMAICIN